MVVIAKRQSDFNADLGAYLDRRRNPEKQSNSFFQKVDSLLPKKMESSRDIPEIDSYQESTIYEGEKKPSFFAVLFRSRKKNRSSSQFADESVEEIEEEINEIDEEVEELQERKESLLARFFSLVFGGKRASAPEDFSEDIESVESVEFDEAELLKQETRATLRVIHKWISRLSPEQIDAFKRSPDFIRYKELLQKYNLTK